jgi:hypothetical protein
MWQTKTYYKIVVRGVWLDAEGAQKDRFDGDERFLLHPQKQCGLMRDIVYWNEVK